MQRLIFDVRPLSEFPEKDGIYWVFEMDKDELKSLDEVTFRNGEWNMMGQVLENPEDYNEFYWTERIQTI